MPLGWLLIDDGWSDADYETKRLNSLGAAPEKFPQGIGHTARVAKEQYGLHQVGVWHALMGYWAGLNPGTPLFRQWESRLMARGEDHVLIPQEETVYDFMSQWHSQLAREDAVDFIKVDGQGSASIYYKGAGAAGAAGAAAGFALLAAKALPRAMTTSISRIRPKNTTA